MKRISLILCCIIYFYIQPVVADNLFTPLVASYSKIEYAAGNQNWSVCQDQNGSIYVGNNAGLLIFNGISWQLIELPTKGIVRSVASAKTGIIYVGSFEEFGYFSKTDVGKMQYNSLIPKLKEFKLNNDDIWQIIHFENKIYYFSLNAVFVYDGKNVVAHRYHDNILSVSMANGRFYAYTQHGGLSIIHPESLKMEIVSECKEIKNIVSILVGEGSQIFLITQRDGVFIFNEKNVFPFTTTCDSFLKKADINRAVLTQDSLLVIGSTLDGLVVVDRQGKVLWKINMTGQLQSNTVLGLYNDDRYNVWIALNEGISVFNTKSSLQKTSILTPRVGTIHTVYKNSNNVYYIGSNQGLYEGKYAPALSGLHISNVLKGHVWDISLHGKDLFCSTSENTVSIQMEGGLKNASPITGGVCFAQGLIHDQEVLIQGSYTHLSIFKKNESGAWTFSHVINDFINPVRYIEIDYMGRIWCSHIHQGLFCLQLSPDLKNISKKDFFSAPLDGGSAFFNVFQVNKRILFLDKYQIYTYDDLTRKIVPHVELNDALSHFKNAYRIVHFQKDLYWFIKNNEAALIVINDKGVQVLDIVSFSTFTENYSDNQQNIITIGKDSCLFCFENTLGLYKQATPKKVPDRNKRTLIVEQFEVSDEFGNVQQLPINKEVIEIPPKHRQLKMVFSYPDFVYGKNIYFTHNLKGFDNLWSEPSKSNVIHYYYLPFGEYSMNIRIVNARGDILSSCSYTIKSLAPFYLSRTAYFLYLLLILLIISFSVLYVKKLIMRNKEKITRHLERENLESEVKRKSKDLANSAMSIIQKNNILLKIKDELTDQKAKLGTQYPVKYFDRIMNLIDSNVSLDKDWLIFQTNFDRIHENFFRNLKIRYPDLSSADLRLCAYLRLNLTTKDIAHLLNITPKGVEVARYRLRKKLNLTSEKSLTDFMIELK